MLRVYAGLVVVFLLAPVAVVVVSAFNDAQLLDFPPVGLSFRWFARFWDSDPFRGAFFVSLGLAARTALVSVVLGTLAALYTVRLRGRLARMLTVLVMAPLQLPAILTGIALLIFLRATGVVDTSSTGLLIGHLLITLPYVYVTVMAGLVSLGTDIEEAARSLGASRLTTLRRVTLPMLRGPLISGASFAFLLSWDQFPISLMLSGIGSRPLPVQLFDYLRFNFDPLPAAVSTISVALSAIGLYLIYRAGGFDTFTRS